ncbi:MAG: EVE domain-containing protein [Verrucomicrobiales bacterium]|nr:EVE domain-containing protein [Verrucomicrobiales bacterium]
MKYWLLKSEPDVFGLDDLKKCPKKTEPWDGIRNYQARNFMRDEMTVGDLALFYHSNTSPPGVAGVVKIVKEAYPDHTAFDPKTKYHDPKSDPENPRWLMVDVQFVAGFPDYVELAQLKADPKLEGMLTLRRGNRLSITPVEKKHFNHICKLGGYTPK